MDQSEECHSMVVSGPNPLRPVRDLQYDSSLHYNDMRNTLFISIYCL